MTSTKTTVLTIGDPHVMCSNIPEVELCIEKLTKLATEKNPDLIVILGDTLHTHERLHTTPLNKAYELVHNMRKIAKTYVLVGNHDTCLGKNTPVLLWNGDVKMSQNVSTGDILIGDDGTPRIVLNTVYGYSQLYSVNQGEGDDYIVNENHILSLHVDHKSIFLDKKNNCWTVQWVDIESMQLKENYFFNNIAQEDGSQLYSSEEKAITWLNSIPEIDTIDISVKEYLKIPRNVQKRLYGFRIRKEISWEKRNTCLDPYILGFWLGDSNKDGTGFSSMDQKVINKWFEWASENKAEIIHTEQYNYSIQSKTNPLLDAIINYSLYNNKHIPSQYIINDVDTRLNLLAGFTDSFDNSGFVTNDGGDIIILQQVSNIHIINAFVYICRSLGLITHVHKDNERKTGRILRISGNVGIIPVISHQVRDKIKCASKEGVRKDEGRKGFNQSRTRISVHPFGYGEYYGWEVNGNNRFLLGDFTVTHNCNNQQYLTENHWLNGMKEWENTVIVDKVLTEVINDCLFVFVPYVPPGRFEDALNTLDNGVDWNDASCIFAHQEFFGCKMGAIVSVEGDKWLLENPEIVSGHIHSNQRPQKNVYYPGSMLQHAFGESSKNIIAYLTYDSKQKGYELEEIDLKLPRKKIVYMDVENVDDYEIPDTKDAIKITVSGAYDQFKALKKTKKYKKLVKDGVKVVFKAKKIDCENKLSENVVNETSFSTILGKIINEEKNSYLYETYELVVNNKKVTTGDIVYLD